MSTTDKLPPLHPADEKLLRRIDNALADLPHQEALVFDVRWRLAHAQGAPRTVQCTGIAAVWCPVHGHCRCASDENGERSLCDADCPLHSIQSDHG